MWCNFYRLLESNGLIEISGHYTVTGETKLISFIVSIATLLFAIVSPNVNSSGALAASKFGFLISNTGFYVSSGGDIYWRATGY